MEWCIRYAICKLTEQCLQKDRSLEEKFIYVTKWSCWEKQYGTSDFPHETVYLNGTPLRKTALKTIHVCLHCGFRSHLNLLPKKD